MDIKKQDIAVIGDEELVNALRLAGISRYYMIKDDDDVGESVRSILTELMAEPDVGTVVILEDYLQYVEDVMAGVRKGRRLTPVIIDVPSKFGTKYPDVRGHYKASIRESIGFDMEL